MLQTIDLLHCFLNCRNIVRYYNVTVLGSPEIDNDVLIKFYTKCIIRVFVKINIVVSVMHSAH